MLQNNAIKKVRLYGIYLENLIFLTPAFILLFILVFVVDVSLISRHFEVDSFLYFFSTTAQALAAVFALTGAIAFFRYERHNLVIKKELDNLNKLLSRELFIELYGPDDYDATILENPEKKAQRFMETPPKLKAENPREYQHLYQIINQYLDRIRSGRKHIHEIFVRIFVFIAAPCLITIMLSLILIPFSKYLYSNLRIGLFSIVLVFYFIFISLTNVFLYFRHSFYVKIT